MTLRDQRYEVGWGAIRKLEMNRAAGGSLDNVASAAVRRARSQVAVATRFGHDTQVPRQALAVAQAARAVQAAVDAGATPELLTYLSELALGRATIRAQIEIDLDVPRKGEVYVRRDVGPNPPELTVLGVDAKADRIRFRNSVTGRHSSPGLNKVMTSGRYVRIKEAS